MKGFSAIRFGKTSAEKESLESPELLLSGFFDPFGYVSAAKAPNGFLFLGYKGSGKSAIGEHLRLAAEGEAELFVRYLSLGDFPYTSFSKIIKGDLEPEAKFPDAWSWLLLLQIIEQLAKDNGSTLQSNSSAAEIYQQLKEAGLLPSSSLKYIVQQTTKRTGGVNWKALTFGRERSVVEGNASDIPFFVEKLKELVISIKSNSRHLLVVDGLDELLGKRAVQLSSLASLVYEIDRLNSSFVRHGCPVKIILLCRTDIYEMLPNANKNKLRQDSAIELNWFTEAADFRTSNLIKLVNHRASVSLGEETDVFERFVPETVTIRHGRKDIIKDSRAFLLEFTRHTPRDLITLMNFVQKEVASKNSIDHWDLEMGAKNYSVAYFVPEIRDELHGYFDSDEIELIISVLGTVGQREFTFSQVLRASDNVAGANLDIRTALFRLFECSALGNIHIVNEHTHFSFKYRNRNAVLDTSKKMMLHRGMWKALNLR
jgi:hypothetical protein